MLHIQAAFWLRSVWYSRMCGKGRLWERQFGPQRLISIDTPLRLGIALGTVFPKTFFYPS